jgi:hypothetical protein
MTSNAVVACTWGEDRDGLPAGAEEVLTLGRKASAALGVELDWLTLGPVPDAVPDAAGRYGVGGLHRISDPRRAPRSSCCCTRAWTPGWSRLAWRGVSARRSW